MQSFEIEGNLLKKYGIEGNTPSTQSREFVLEIQDGNYPQYIKFQLIQERCYFLDSFEEGETIKVFFEFHGAEQEGYYKTFLQALSIEKVSPKQHRVYKYQSEFDKHRLQNCPPDHYRELKMTSYRFVFQEQFHENNFLPVFVANPARVNAKTDSVSKWHGLGLSGGVSNVRLTLLFVVPSGRNIGSSSHKTIFSRAVGTKCELHIPYLRHGNACHFHALPTLRPDGTRNGIPTLHLMHRRGYLCIKIKKRQKRSLGNG